MEKVSSQPGKCINQDLQDPNQIKWMITTGPEVRGSAHKRRNKIQQDCRATSLKVDAIRKTTEIKLAISSPTAEKWR